MPNPDADQLERFKRKARELECDESEEAFEDVFGQIVPPVKPNPEAERTDGD